MKKIIITGATSMIGTALIKVAVRENTEVYAIIRPDTKRGNRIISSPLIHPVYGALRKLEEIKGLPVDCDVFYHFAWAGTNKAERDDPEIQEENIGYTLDAVRLAKRAGCKRFVGAGSQAEYGFVDGVIDGDTKCCPATSYGMAKYAAGLLSKKYCDKEGMDHVWGRIFSVYGPHDHEGTMTDYAIKCWEDGKVARFSSGKQLWNYLYESDAGEIFYRLGQDCVPAGTWFVANTESRPLREYIEIMMKVYGPDAFADFAVEASKKLTGLNVDVRKTMEVLDYRPCVGFEEGIGRILQERGKLK